MNPLFLALASYLCWGSGDIFGTISSRKLGAYSTTLWMNFIGLVLFSLYIPFALDDLRNLTLPLFIYSLILGVLFFAGELAFNEATRSSNASLAGTIAASYTAVTVLLSVLIFHESITLTQVIPIVVIFGGIVLCNIDLAELKQTRNPFTRGTLLAVLAMFLWGGYFALLKPIVKHIGPFWPTYFVFLLLPFLFLIMRAQGIRLESIRKNKALVPIAIAALLLRGGDMIFNAAIRSGHTATIAPIAGSYPTLFVILAFLVFKDPITKQQRLGLAITLAGVVALSFVGT